MDDLRMTSNEKLKFDLAEESATLGLAASTLDTVAACLLALPKIQSNIAPMAMGVSMQFDGSNVAKFMAGNSSALKLFAQMKNDQGSRASRKAQMIRQLQDRQF